VSAAIPPEEAASAMAAIDDRRAWLADRSLPPAGTTRRSACSREPSSP